MHNWPIAQFFYQPTMLANDVISQSYLPFYSIFQITTFGRLISFSQKIANGKKAVKQACVSNMTTHLPCLAHIENFPTLFF